MATASPPVPRAGYVWAWLPGSRTPVPLRRGWIPPRENMTIAGVLKDASPDSWGQRVIITRLTGTRGIAAADVELDTLTYLLESGSNRIGGLDLQSSAETYMARSSGASLLELHTAAQDLVAGTLSPELAEALQYCTAIGGARPKAIIVDEDGGEVLPVDRPVPRRQGRGGWDAPSRARGH